MPAALQSFEQVGAAETFQPDTGSRQVGQEPGLFRRRRLARRRRLVVPQPVARQGQAIDRVHDAVGKQARVLIPKILRADREFDGLGDAGGEILPGPVREFQVLAIHRRVELGVVLLNKAARPPHEIQPHQLAPIVRVLALFEGGQRTHRALMAAKELRFAQIAQVPLGASADVLGFVHKQTELIRQVEIGLVVRRCGEQDHAAVVASDVLRDRPVPRAFAVAQVVAFVDQHQPIPAQVGQLALDVGDR
jgi:hypothetical protein